MLRETFEIIVRNWFVYVALVVAAIAVAIFDEMSGKTTSSGATTFMWTYAAMCVQGVVIYSGTFADVGRRSSFGKMLPYVLKTAALLIIALAISLPVFIIAPSGAGDVLPANVLIFISVALVAYALVLALLGTWPTSSITGVGTSLADALRRGLSRFFPTFGRLLAGIILPLVLSMVVVVVLSQVSQSPQMMVDGKPNVVVLAASIIAALLQAISVSYSAVVLARVYVSQEPLAAASA